MYHYFKMHLQTTRQKVLVKFTRKVATENKRASVTLNVVSDISRTKILRTKILELILILLCLLGSQLVSYFSRYAYVSFTLEQ